MQISRTLSAALDFLDALFQFMAARMLSKKEKPLSNQDLIFLNYVITRIILIPVNIILYLETVDTTSKRLLVCSSLFYDSLVLVQYMIIIHLLLDQSSVFWSKLRDQILFNVKTTKVVISICWIIAGIIVVTEIIIWDLTTPRLIRGLYVLRFIPLFQGIFVLLLIVSLLYLCIKINTDNATFNLPTAAQKRKMLYMSLLVVAFFFFLVVIPDIIRIPLISSHCTPCSFQIDWHIFYSLSGIFITITSILTSKSNPAISASHATEERDSNIFVRKLDIPLQIILQAACVYVEGSGSQDNSEMYQRECQDSI